MSGQLQYCGVMAACSPIWLATGVRLAGRFLRKCAARLPGLLVVGWVGKPRSLHCAPLSGPFLYLTAAILLPPLPAAAPCATAAGWTAASRASPTPCPACST